MRVPFADFNALKLPPGTAHEEDFAMLADIFPTVKTPACVLRDLVLIVCNRDGMALSCL